MIKRKSYTVGVIGLGKFGVQFAQAMQGLGHEVIGIDRHQDRVNQAQEHMTQAYQADAMDKTALEQMGFADLSHVLISVGDSIASSSMITYYLKEMEVPYVWVKAIHADHEQLLRRIGATEVIIPEISAARELAHRLAMPGFVEYLPFGTDLALQEVIVDKWAGKSLRELDLTRKAHIQVVAARPSNEEKYDIIPQPDDPLNEGDALMLLGKSADLQRLKA
ncbi:potassium channel family protein [Desulfohalobium retbaense]|uniref:TrkA-N domain protein n=1 Tax=Desulfohalobium retbaense (strain ATCC 49708 / DSM 5692 / JCM 16813 / HR100) TaxID=485915 RepID=C8X3T0_DESRD|nr:TrkA family potassium uptake protein [Desulfohalobium retbaense]ACV69077.1 TrkA-N domain protein [Desulfohalobium retbaense DSM 5692]